MTASVLTFSVQLGSDGNAIAHAVADKLGYSYYDREVITQAASYAGVSPETVASAERWPSFLERMLEALGRASALSDAMPGPHVATPQVLTMTSADYRGLIEQVVRELANRGDCVIVNHAGQAILRDRPSTFKVLVHGSVERRTQRTSAERKLSPEEARELVEASDKQRLEFFEHVYKVEWLDSALYDLAVNTDEVDTESAVALVMTGVAAVP